jgi:hypothetical protein
VGVADALFCVAKSLHIVSEKGLWDNMSGITYSTEVTYYGRAGFSRLGTESSLGAVKRNVFSPHVDCAGISLYDMQLASAIEKPPTSTNNLLENFFECIDVTSWRLEGNAPKFS